jgi:hypothetical protein
MKHVIGDNDPAAVIPAGTPRRAAPAAARPMSGGRVR